MGGFLGKKKIPPFPHSHCFPQLFDVDGSLSRVSQQGKYVKKLRWEKASGEVSKEKSTKRK